MKKLYTIVSTKAALNTLEEIHQYNGTKKRNRNIKWLNSPFSETYKTNIAKTFFRILDKHFPNSHLLYKIFNRNTAKVSYSCMDSVSQIVNQHNKNLSNKKEKQTNSCKYRNKNEFPLNGIWKEHSLIYKCTVSTMQKLKQRIYLGIAQRNWK